MHNSFWTLTALITNLRNDRKLNGICNLLLTFNFKLQNLPYTFTEYTSVINVVDYTTYRNIAHTTRINNMKFGPWIIIFLIFINVIINWIITHKSQSTYTYNYYYFYVGLVHLNNFSEMHLLKQIWLMNILKYTSIGLKKIIINYFWVATFVDRRLGRLQNALLSSFMGRSLHCFVH